LKKDLKPILLQKGVDSSRSSNIGDYMFRKKLTSKSIIEIIIPIVEPPEKLKWLEKNFLTKFFLELIKKTVMPKVVNLRNTLEHELIHYKDPSIKIVKKQHHGFKPKNSEETSTINYRDSGRGYYTSGGEISGGVPIEFYPRIWTIIRNCKNEQDKQELINWIKKTSPHTSKMYGRRNRIRKIYLGKS
jgi:hypothetical protein